MRAVTAECQARHLRAVTEWTEAREQPAPPEPETSSPADITINELTVGYLAHADRYYVKNGQPTGEATNIRYGVAKLRERFGDLLAGDFGPTKRKRSVNCILKSQRVVGRMGRSDPSHREPTSWPDPTEPPTGPRASPISADPA